MELEHEAEHRKPGECALLFVHMRGGPATDQHLARRRQIEQAEQIEQRRFARAGRPGDRDELVVADRSNRRLAPSVVGTMPGRMRVTLRASISGILAAGPCRCGAALTSRPG